MRKKGEVWLLLVEPGVILETFSGESFGGLGGEHVAKGALAIVGELQRANIALNLILHLGTVL